MVDEYNAVAGSSLDEDMPAASPGDSNLRPTRTSSRRTPSSLASPNHCERPHRARLDPRSARRQLRLHPPLHPVPTKAHLGLRPAGATDVDGKYPGGTSFRAVLLHEMGHASVGPLTTS